MASDRQMAANRANAKKSSGPRSKNGKANSSRNAVRHGLASAVRTDIAVTEDIERLAKALSTEGTGPTDFAYQAAGAEVDLLRIRKIRARILDDVVGRPEATLADHTETNLNLARLDRYERRVYTRRRRAFQAMMGIGE